MQFHVSENQTLLILHGYCSPAAEIASITFQLLQLILQNKADTCIGQYLYLSEHASMCFRNN